MQQRPRVAFELHALTGQPIVHGVLEVARPGLVAPCRIHRLSADLLRDICYDVIGQAAAQDEPCPAFTQSMAQTFEALVQPPAGGGSWRPAPGRFLVQDKQGQYWSARFGRGRQGGLVGEPQIVAKPDDDRAIRQRTFLVFSQPGQFHQHTTLNAREGLLDYGLLQGTDDFS